jgi:hypothetical protein
MRDVPMAVFDQSPAPRVALLDAYQATDFFKLAYSVTSTLSCSH